MKKIKRIVIFMLCLSKLAGQNLISNPSFSEVNQKKDSTSFYTLLPGCRSEVKDWYLPEYINYEPKGRYKQGPLYSDSYYYTSRDKELVIQKRLFSNGDQLLENNLGFVRLNINNHYPIAIIQHHFKEKLSKGKYCFKFKYKRLAWRAPNRKDVALEFSFSSTNLKEYYKKNLSVPSKKKQVVFEDDSKMGDENTPWQQQCFVFELSGEEEFLTIGTLSDKTESKYVLSSMVYLLDDLELYFLEEIETCPCEVLNKDLRGLYNREFPLNTELTNDTLILFTPMNTWSPDIVSPPAKHFLNQVISFLQRNPDLNIHFIEHHSFNDINKTPAHYWAFRRYISFFGIEDARISAKCGPCLDTANGFCLPDSEYLKIGIGFYRNN